MASEPQHTHEAEAEEHEPREPLILWWMPLLALVAPATWALWAIVSADSDPLKAAAESLVWPGSLLYSVSLAIFWGGWKIELE